MGVFGHVLKSALDEMRQAKTVKSVPKESSISHVTLSSNCKKLQTLRETRSTQLSCVGDHSSLKVFNVQHYLTEVAHFHVDSLHMRFACKNLIDPG